MTKSRLRKKNNEAILDVEEYGVLCMTCSSSISDGSEDKKDVMYTSKESYLWVPIIAYLVKETELSSKDINTFLELCLDAMGSNQRSKWGNRGEGLDSILKLVNSMLFYSTRLRFENPIFTDPVQYAASIEDIIERLQRLGLIEEYFNQFMSNSYFSVLGYVPIGFSKRTKLGEALLNKLNSMMMFYAKKEIITESDFDVHYKYRCVWQDFMEKVKRFDGNILKEK